jgi:hypothetical protein
MKFKDLKVGDTVFVASQDSRWSSRRFYGTYTVTKVGRKYGTFGIDNKFDLATGMSVHGECSVRANGYGFDVFVDSDDYETSQHDIKMRARLRELIRHVDVRDLKLSSVEKIVAVLESEEAENNS